MKQSLPSAAAAETLAETPYRARSATAQQHAAGGMLLFTKDAHALGRRRRGRNGWRGMEEGVCSVAYKSRSGRTGRTFESLPSPCACHNHVAPQKLDDAAQC